jgi:hypothetical protein
MKKEMAAGAAVQKGSRPSLYSCRCKCLGGLSYPAWSGRTAGAAVVVRLGPGALEAGLNMVQMVYTLTAACAPFFGVQAKEVCSAGYE